MSVYGRAHTHGVPVTADVGNADEDWETDPDYSNDVGEKGQRWGSKEIVPPKKTGGLETTNLPQLAKEVGAQNDEAAKKEWFDKRTLYGGEREDK